VKGKRSKKAVIKLEFYSYFIPELLQTPVRRLIHFDWWGEAEAISPVLKIMKK
jgi:hypothetical protein